MTHKLRRMGYIHELEKWPAFEWNDKKILPLLSAVRHNQGRLLGRMEGLGFQLKEEATLHTLTEEVIQSSDIEGEILDADQVRSSVARKLGMDIVGLVPADRHVEGIVEMMLDATQNDAAELTEDRLFSWHASLFPTGRSGMHRITVGNWRTGEKGAMQVVSGRIGKETVHFEAPAAKRVPAEMQHFLTWFNRDQGQDPVMKAAIAHLWFVTIHPFADGNGRIGRAIADMLLARSDAGNQRFYSMSSEIRKQRKAYYATLEATQKADLDITNWLEWFLQCLHTAIDATHQASGNVMQKARFWERQASIALSERQKGMINKLLDGFDGKLNTAKWAKITEVSHDTALRDINDLIEKCVLMKEEGGSKNTSYVLNAGF